MCTCEHAQRFHLAGLKACRIGGCSCQAFRDPDEPDVPETGPRRVTIDVPAGYMLSISLVPYTEPPAEPADEAAV